MSAAIAPETKGRILVVDDDAAMRELLVQGLTTHLLSVEAAPDAQSALERVAVGDVDVVLTDLRMPGLSGLELCARLAPIPVIVLTAFGDYDTAVQAIRAGAYDFIAKPVRTDVLRIAIERALAHVALRREVRRLESSLESARGSGAIIGESQAVQDVLHLVARAAGSDSSVLITGESGTGKEIVARLLHEESHLPGPFVAVNCAAIPEQLLESELFGHEKGAFTDARSSRVGLFVQADRGTLFLDEIGELPLGLQPKLLRALQERQVRPLGGRRDVPFNVRLVAATNRDLTAAVAEERFRQDLYFRINVIEVFLPPLRARGNDVLLLAMHFLRQFAARMGKPVVGLAPEVAERLLAYDWPGNVRELSNAIERGVALTTHDHITLADLPKTLLQPPKVERSLPVQTPELVSLEEMERRYIMHVLGTLGGNRAAAARVLGLDRTTLWRRLERYGVKGPATPKA